MTELKGPSESFKSKPLLFLSTISHNTARLLKTRTFPILTILKGCCRISVYIWLKTLF